MSCVRTNICPVMFEYNWSHFPVMCQGNLLNLSFHVGGQLIFVLSFLRATCYVMCEDNFSYLSCNVLGSPVLFVLSHVRAACHFCPVVCMGNLSNLFFHVLEQFATFVLSCVRATSLICPAICERETCLICLAMCEGNFIFLMYVGGGLFVCKGLLYFLSVH